MIPRYEDPVTPEMKALALAQVDRATVEALGTIDDLQRCRDALLTCHCVYNLPTLATLRQYIHRHGVPTDPYIPFWVAPWAASGFPVVTLSEMLAAELACTALPTDTELIRSPWPAWFIVNDFDRTECISVHWNERRARWDLGVIDRQTAAQIRAHDDALSRTTAAEIAGYAADVFRNPPRRVLDPKTRSQSLLASLVGNLCVAMAAGQVRLKACGPVLPRAGRVSAPATLRAQADVAIDLRPVLRAYIAGETGPRWRLAVRSYVRGFWRRAPGAALDAKTIWVRPHWRGPHDGALANRLHRVISSPGQSGLSRSV